MLASLYHILQVNFYYLNKLKSWNKIKLTADFSLLITVSKLSFLSYQNLLKCYCRKKRYNVIGAPYCISEMKAPPCGIKTAVLFYLHNTSSENGWCQPRNTDPWSASLLPPWTGSNSVWGSPLYLLMSVLRYHLLRANMIHFHLMRNTGL